MLLLFRISTEPFYTRFNEVTQNVENSKNGTHLVPAAPLKRR